MNFPCVLLHAWQEVPGWGQGGTMPEVDNAHKNVLIGLIYNLYRNVLFTK